MQFSFREAIAACADTSFEKECGDSASVMGAVFKDALIISSQVTLDALGLDYSNCTFLTDSKSFTKHRESSWCQLCRHFWHQFLHEAAPGQTGCWKRHLAGENVVAPEVAAIDIEVGIMATLISNVAMVSWIQTRHMPAQAHVSWQPCLVSVGFRNTGGSLQWRHNEHHGVSNHQLHDSVLMRSFRRRSKKTSKLRVTGVYEGPRTKSQ